MLSWVQQDEDLVLVSLASVVVAVGVQEALEMNLDQDPVYQHWLQEQVQMVLVDPVDLGVQGVQGALVVLMVAEVVEDQVALEDVGDQDLDL